MGIKVTEMLIAHLTLESQTIEGGKLGSWLHHKSIGLLLLLVKRGQKYITDYGTMLFSTSVSSPITTFSQI